MASYFLDTSAIVKRYTTGEQGHSWITSLCNPEQGNKLYIAQAALVEVVAAMCRKCREQSITSALRDELITNFRRDIQNDYEVWRVTSTIYTSTGNLCRLHRLRAYDAVQLACALQLRNRALTHDVSAAIFVSADNELLEFALSEGFSVENPNKYL